MVPLMNKLARTQGSGSMKRATSLVIFSLTACGAPQPSHIEVMRAQFDAAQHPPAASPAVIDPQASIKARLNSDLDALYAAREQRARNEVAKYGKRTVNLCAAQAAAAPVSSSRQDDVYYYCLEGHGPVR